MAQADDIVILSATRTAGGRFRGALRSFRAPALGASVIREAVSRARLEPAMVDEVLMGNVLQAGLGQAPARQASVAAGLPTSVGATAVNKVCGSGLKAVMLGAAMIRASDAQIIVAGGMESMNGAPYLLTQARFGYRMGQSTILDAMVHDGLWCSLSDQHMGLAAEWIGEAQGVSREEMDAYALESHRRAVAAIDRGAFEGEIVPIEVPRRGGTPITFSQDECPRRDTSLAKLAHLPPAFCDDGRVTAGNASSIADGAAAVVITTVSRAQALGLAPMARIVSYAQAAVEPGEIFTAPVYAIRNVLRRAHMELGDLDLIELNEAFAAQTVANGRTLHLDWDRLNVNGGAIALGHPIGASGARILVTLLHGLLARRLERGVAAVCLGGGEAIAMIVELV